jgi:hypothetical protein
VSVVTLPRQRLHVAQRPLWICRVEAQPWPCGEARLRLIAESREDPIAVRMYLGSILDDMIGDLLTLNPDTAPTPEALYERVLGWLPSNHLA